MKGGISIRLSGDLGDAIYAVSLLSVLGGKNTVYAVDRPGITAPFVSRFHLLKPLLEAQKYIKDTKCTEEDPDVDLVNFRKFHSHTTTLIKAQCSEFHSLTGEYLDADGEDTWLEAKPNTAFKDKVVIARSPRYNNELFPWRKIVQHYGDRLVFVGMPVEHEQFCRNFGDVKYNPVKDFLELAQIISGCAFFIGNQSSPMAVAMGLGKDLIQEVCLWQPDCIYKRENAQYSANGGLTLPNVAGSGELVIPDRDKPAMTFHTCVVPPGGWHYPKLPPCTHFKIQQRHVVNLEKCTEDEAKERLAKYNLHRIPQFFRPMNNDPLELFWQAYEKAFKIQPTPIK